MTRRFQKITLAIDELIDDDHDPAALPWPVVANVYSRLHGERMTASAARSLKIRAFRKLRALIDSDPNMELLRRVAS